MSSPPVVMLAVAITVSVPGEPESDIVEATWLITGDHGSTGSGETTPATPDPVTSAPADVL